MDTAARTVACPPQRRVVTLSSGTPELECPAPSSPPHHSPCIHPRTRAMKQPPAPTTPSPHVVCRQFSPSHVCSPLPRDCKEIGRPVLNVSVARMFAPMVRSLTPLRRRIFDVFPRWPTLTRRSCKTGLYGKPPDVGLERPSRWCFPPPLRQQLPSECRHGKRRRQFERREPCGAAPDAARRAPRTHPARHRRPVPSPFSQSRQLERLLHTYRCVVLGTSSLQTGSRFQIVV